MSPTWRIQSRQKHKRPRPNVPADIILTSFPVCVPLSCYCGCDSLLLVNNPDTVTAEAVGQQGSFKVGQTGLKSQPIFIPVHQSSMLCNSPVWCHHTMVTAFSAAQQALGARGWIPNPYQYRHKLMCSCFHILFLMRKVDIIVFTHKTGLVRVYRTPWERDHVNETLHDLKKKGDVNFTEWKLRMRHSIDL